MIVPKAHIKRVERIPDRFEPRQGLVRLDKNERVIPFPKDTLDALLRTLTSGDLTAYPAVEPMYRLIAEWLDVPRECVLLTSGSDQAIKSVFEVYVEAGDVVALPRPTFAMYGVYCGLFGAVKRELTYDRDLTLGVDSVCRAITSEVKVVALPNPNAPTGTLFGALEMEAVLQQALKHNALVLVDEAYFNFSSVTMAPYIDRYDNLVVTRTFSKACGLAGVRLGFILSAPANIDYLRRVKPMYEASGVALKIGEFMIRNSRLIQEYADAANEGLAFLKERFRTVGHPFDSVGNFLVVRMPSDVDIPKLVSDLKEEGFLIKGPFSDEPLRDCIRVTTGPVSLMSEFWKAFESVYHRLPRTKEAAVAGAV